MKNRVDLDKSASLHVKETLARYPAKKSPGGQSYPEKRLTFRTLWHNLDQTRGTNPGIVLTNLKLDEPATKAYGAASARFLWLFFSSFQKGEILGSIRYRKMALFLLLSLLSNADFRGIRDITLVGKYNLLSGSSN